MNRRLIQGLFTVIAMFLANQAYSQVMTNCGVLYVNQGAVVQVNGSALNLSNTGVVTVENNATVTVTGSWNVQNGSVTFNGASTGLVRQDLITNGACDAPNSVVTRNGSGTLRVQGNITNDGRLVNNASTIIVEQDLNNAGKVENNNGLIEIGVQ